MMDSEFIQYIKKEWSFLRHAKGFWGGASDIDIIEIKNMSKNHLENSIAMIKKWDVKLPEDQSDKTRLEKLKLKKLNELESALKRK